MATPRCLLFDCDGTLVDSEPLLAAEMAESLTQAGLPFSPSDYMGEFRGARFCNIVAELQRRHGSIDPQRLSHSEGEMRRRLADRIDNELLPLPGVREALDALGDFPRAVVSNGPESKIRAGLRATGLAEAFGDNLFSGYTANCWKPDPCLYLHAASIMGYRADECLAIDDAIVGVKAALAAGMRVVHLNRFPDVEATPDGAISISNMHQLPTVIGRLLLPQVATT
ncbi:haloacid dehalogenase superfamily, subfamily IA, variant 3 with third motif having DD or ED [Franzmannia pantelleriensis]|uniref:Haloacid dehalogenase superfamily, subfamily IA, variant 3 with third motif having DD or ED n=1 Tax=Franzmannia pantelleriensis TaxID=48727 RepID=A0A1G9W8I3_9GAMM|nr:HAD-IA family hydrolase [Halomonas pantelleriensis]SDM80526.1 haloacid dehalogenase superfamily, subfamily IA, variant 3 with third motif having DD or ED [Halomonas pantelleriensis]